jgi:hypothetical protein
VVGRGARSDERLIGDGGRGSARFDGRLRVCHRMPLGLDRAIMAVVFQQIIDPM